mmetsp:Transcript_5319/g.12829  ORF Transcript_5319/g.12829 Transcript_5319/m.12829 type:complete len:254 (-) Transcript_5319:931-1692(-)
MAQAIPAIHCRAFLHFHTLQLALVGKLLSFDGFHLSLLVPEPLGSFCQRVVILLLVPSLLALLPFFHLCPLVVLAIIRAPRRCVQLLLERAQLGIIEALIRGRSLLHLGSCRVEISSETLGKHLGGKGFRRASIVFLLRVTRLECCSRLCILRVRVDAPAEESLGLVDFACITKRDAFAVEGLGVGGLYGENEVARLHRAERLGVADESEGIVEVARHAECHDFLLFNRVRLATDVEGVIHVPLCLRVPPARK